MSLQRLVALAVVGPGLAFALTGAAPGSAPGPCDPRSHGLVGDGTTPDTGALQRALDACAAAGGGVVSVPAGRYRVAPLALPSRTTLALAEGATLLGSTQHDDYPIRPGRYEGVERPGHAALIGIHDAEDVAIVGAGVIDGQGAAWWDDFEAGRLEHPRPHLVDVVRSRRVRIEGVTLRDSPSWTLHPLYSEGVAIRNVRIESPPESPNTDGIDIDSSRRVRIEGCHIDVGDDCIAIKSGRDADGRRVGRPSEEVEIRDCSLVRGHGGVVIGSETAGGVRGVRVSNVRMHGTKRGIRLKTRRGRGGVVEDVVVRGTRMDGVAEPLVMNMAYVGDGGVAPASTQRNAGTPTFRDIHVEDLVAVGAIRAGRLRGLEESPLADVRLRDVHLEALEGLQVKEARNVTLSDVRLAVRRGGALRARHVVGLAVRGLQARLGQPWHPVLRLEAVSGATLAEGHADRSEVWLKLEGPDNRNVELAAPSVRHLGRAVILADGATRGALAAVSGSESAPPSSGALR